MKKTIWIVSTCIPRAGEGPCIPTVFATSQDAEEFADTMMRSEWNAYEPEDGNGRMEYPGDWRAAQDALVEWNGPEWGTWAITTHTVEFQDDANHVANIFAFIEVVAPWVEDFGDYRITNLMNEAKKQALAVTPPSAAEYPIRRFLDASTAHVSEQAGAWLDEQGAIAAAVRTSQDEQPAINIGRIATGWFFYADEGTIPADLGAPDDVIRLMQEARKRGCDYVLLDADAEHIDGLPVYDW